MPVAQKLVRKFGGPPNPKTPLPRRPVVGAARSASAADFPAASRQVIACTGKRKGLVATERIAMLNPSQPERRSDAEQPEAAPGLLSRRSMLRGAAGAGAAGLAISGLAMTGLASPAMASTAPAAGHEPARAPAAADGPASTEPLVVHVRDLRTGEMDVYRGTGHARIHDRALAASLARAAG
jgi:hypothetical protein